jgi:hypothetical protein
MSEQPNPYAAPVRGSEHAPAPGGFRLSDDLRRQIGGVAKLMIAAGGLQITSSTLGLIRGGISVETLATSAIAGIVPLFWLIAGVTLNGIASRDEGNDLAGLLSGFRQLHVAFVVKGVTLVGLIVLGLLMLLAMMFGMGRSLF